MPSKKNIDSNRAGPQAQKVTKAFPGEPSVDEVDMPGDQNKSGMVYLVGAGPGDAGLLTMRGAECLRESDVVVYDYLANESLLAYAPVAAERIYVGKTAAQHTKTQAEINELLAEHAGAGKTVTRLKGGDPFVFGRGGEEAMYLSERQIAFEIIPGVTSAIAVPAYAGIPVTQRNVNVSFHVITGHEDPEKGEPEVEWDALARMEGTLIFMMGVGNIGEIAENLMKRGKDRDTPVALIRWGTLPEQETLVTTLQMAAEDVARENFHPPAVTVVGPVVSLRPLVQWYENKPLFGVRAAVTRPMDQSEELTAALRRAGADVCVFPTIRVQPRLMNPSIKSEIGGVAGYDWIIFTSVNAVRLFFGLLYEAKHDARALHDCRIAAIGEKTAEALKNHGICPDIVPREAVQEGLAKAIKITKGDHVLVPRASSARDALQTSLEERGAKVNIMPVYDTVADKDGIAELKRQLTRGRIHLCTFTSSSTIERFAEAVKVEDLPKLFSDVTIASIGEVTTKTLKNLGLRAHIEAEKATSAGLADAIMKYFKSRRR